MNNQKIDYENYLIDIKENPSFYEKQKGGKNEHNPKTITK